MNIRLIAMQFGDLLKYDTSLNIIDRIEQSILKVSKESFPNSYITSQRAQAIHDWLMSLGKQKIEQDERAKKIVEFCMELSSDELKGEVAKLLEKNGLPYNIVYKDSLSEFFQRNFHEEIIKHSKKLFLQGNYFHVVFESAKAFNNDVKNKSQTTLDGEKLMMNVFSLSGVLKITTCETETDKNVQEGIKFLSSGLMRAIRNPTAHEPAITWPIDKQDCLDILSLISFLFRQYDKSVYYEA